MGILGFGGGSCSPAVDYEAIRRRYKTFRPVRSRLNNELVGRLSKDILHDGARKLGILRRGVLVFDNLDESQVLMDYCIYNVFRNGRNAVEQYLYDCPRDLDIEEMECLRAMQRATYALIVVLDVRPGVGCIVRNLFTDETRLLADVGLASTATPGTLLATRLLDFGEYIATGGAALPVGVLDDAELSIWQERIGSGKYDGNEDPAELIRAYRQNGASSMIRYQGTSSKERVGSASDSMPQEIASRSRPRLRNRTLGKPVGNQRCRCGSGKMFKNCCGKRGDSR